MIRRVLQDTLKMLKRFVHTVLVVQTDTSHKYRI